MSGGREGERESKKAKMNDGDNEMIFSASSTPNEDDRMILDELTIDNNNMESEDSGIMDHGQQDQNTILNNIDPSQFQLPEAECVDQFLENPLMVRPKAEFLNLLYQEDDTILTHAVKIQNVDAVASLVRAGANPNTTNRKGITPISAAAHKGNVAVMKILIDGGAVVNALNSSGSTALIQASHFGHVEAVSLLIKHKAVVDFANTKGTTALMRASQEGHVAISKILINAGVDVNRKNNEGMNALMLASQRGHSEMALLLIRARAVVDEQTAQGSTALMLACKRGHEKVVEVLVSMGAELYVRDSRQRCARDTAEKRHHEKLLKYLDTQIQIRNIQTFRAKQRAGVLSNLREAFRINKLRLDNKVLKAISVLIDVDNAGGRQFEGVIPQLSSVKLTPAEINNSTVMLNRSSRGYQDYMWPLLLLKVFEMPFGVSDLIVDFLPVPRIWDWSISQLKRRCRLAPRVAILDSYIIIDEILGDNNLFSGSEQKGLLVKLAASPERKRYCIEELGMKESLVNSLCKWSDLQSLMHRTEEDHITFKAPLARQVLQLARAAHRWYTPCTSPLKALAQLHVSHSSASQRDATALNDSSQFSNDEMITESTDLVDDEASLMDHDQDTETENLAENDMEQDDHDDLESDEEGDGVGANGVGHHGVGFAWHE